MLIDGLTLTEGSTIKNLTVAYGTSFPSLPDIGELFYRTDASLGLQVYDGSAWGAVGGGGTSDASALTGTTLASNVVSSSLTSVGTLSALSVAGTATAGTFSGSGASLTSIPNSALTNSSITIGSTSVALGASATTIAGLSSVTSTSFTGALTGAASSNVLKAGDTMTGLLILSADPTAALGAVTKQYVDNVAAGVTVHSACETATTAALPANTYSNGTGGIGATITGTVNASLNTVTIGGYSTMAVGTRVLVKNEATGTHNGVYTVTALGAPDSPGPGAAWVLTRASDFDGTPTTEIIAGALVFVQEGTLAGTQWVETAVGSGHNVSPAYDYIVIGTDNITFTQFSGAGTYTAGTGISVSSNVIANTGVTSIVAGTNVTISGGTGAVTINATSGAAAAGSLTGTTLASNVVSSSLTSVGTLTSLNLSGALNMGTSGTIFLNAAANAISMASGPASSSFSIVGSSNGGVGGAISITSGNGVGSSGAGPTGGLLSLTAGNAGGGSTALGGSISILAGTGGSGGAGGGNVTIQAGDGSSGAAGGNLILNGGVSHAGGGNASIIHQTGDTTLVERFRINVSGAWSVGSSGVAYGTSGQVLTSNGGGSSPSWQTASGTAAAGTLTGTTLASNVVSSSLTSVGTLSGLTTTGTVTMSGTPKITGDFTTSSLVIQTNVANNYSGIAIRPTGTSGFAYMALDGGSDPLNMAYSQMATNVGSSEHRFDFDKVGTGSYYPVKFFLSGAEKFRFNTGGELGIAGANYGTSGQVLTSGGTGASPSWQTISTLASLTVTGTITTGGLEVGTKVMPQSSQSAAYTTVLADSGKHLLHPSADTTARTFTIDSNANVAYPIGTALTFVNQNGAGAVTIAITSDTMRLAGAGTTGSRTLAANGVATALKITATEWIISGTNLT